MFLGLKGQYIIHPFITMEKINAVITGVGGYLPEYVLNNEELSKMVDTSDEWIMTRIGIKERRILTEEGLGTSYMARKAVKQVLQKTGTDPNEIDCVIVASTTPDYKFPTVSSIVVGKCGMHNAHCIDMAAACCGFLYAMDTAAAMIQSGRYKKIIVCGADKMSSMVDYTDRATCPIFGDGAGAVLVEATNEDFGWKDSLLRADGMGFPYLHLMAGGSAVPATHFTLDSKMHFIHQEGRAVYKHAVTNMSDVSAKIAERNGLNNDNIDWVLPHQANLRIIEAVVNRLGTPMDHVMVNIGRYGNTSAACMPLCLMDYEKQLKKGDNIILTAFGAGFTWGAAYMKWGYNG